MELAVASVPLPAVDDMAGVVVEAEGDEVAADPFPLSSELEMTGLVVVAVEVAEVAGVDVPDAIAVLVAVSEIEVLVAVVPALAEEVSEEEPPDAVEGAETDMASELWSVNAITVVVPAPFVIAHDIGSAPAETEASPAPIE